MSMVAGSHVRPTSLEAKDGDALDVGRLREEVKPSELVAGKCKVSPGFPVRPQLVRRRMRGWTHALEHVALAADVLLEEEADVTSLSVDVARDVDEGLGCDGNELAEEAFVAALAWGL